MDVSIDSLKEFSFTFIVLAVAVVAVYMITQRYNLAEHFTGSLMTSAPLPLMQVQHVGQVLNPFVLNLQHSRTASLKDGACFTLTSSIPCWLGAVWGAKIADVYPIIHSPWSSFQDHAKFKQSLCNISQHIEEFEFEEAVEKKEVTLKAPSFLDLGLPPRARYPILLIALDSHALNSPWSEVQYLQQILKEEELEKEEQDDNSSSLALPQEDDVFIKQGSVCEAVIFNSKMNQTVCMVAIVHLQDDHCPSESHIFSQLVRCPLGRPCDLKQLYMSGLEDSNTNESTSHYTDDGRCQSSYGDGSAASAALCSVCQSVPVEQAILPCRHACTCTGCCSRLINCPICRAFIISSFPLDSA